MDEPKEKHIYKNNWQHITDELAELDLILQIAVLKSRKYITAEPKDAFKGLYLSDQEIDEILMVQHSKLKKQNSQVEEDTKIKKLINDAGQLRKEISQKKEASLAKGVYLALPQLSHLFGLSPFEERIVVICLAPELDRKCEKLYAYLQDDVTRKKPGIELVLNLLCTTQEEKIAARSYFLPQASLFKNRILQVIEDPQNSQTPLLSKYLKMDDRIVNFLIGVGVLDQKIESFSKLVYPQPGKNEITLSKELKTKLITLTQNHLRNPSERLNKLIYFLYGPYGSGKKSLAEAICNEINVLLMVTDVEELSSRELPFDETIHMVFREALLQPAAIYLEGMQWLLDEEKKNLSHMRILKRAIEDFSWLTFLSGDRVWELTGLFNNNTFIKVEFPVPDYDTRNELWKKLTDGNSHLYQEIDFGELATKFNFTPGQINDALVSARNHALLSHTDISEITMEDFYSGCRAQCNQKLGTLARKINPKYSWEDIVLPKDTLHYLHMMCDQVKYRHCVYSQWGFDRKLSLGKGLNALFSGPSGTGKTMSAEIIANELQLDLYKIDLSSVVSKYIGETEKNLSKIFHEAESSNAILFFDEADALFGKRSEVKDAHDRYANIEIGYLLQKMEEYEGISILATNLKKNIDEAFLRRLHFLVEFPFPDENYRYQIWKSIFPKETPVSKDIDFEFLSNRFKIAGGSIKNIAVNAAFLAAGNSRAVNMEHIIQATQQEYQKIGIPYNQSDFGKYADLVRLKEN